MSNCVSISDQYIHSFLSSPVFGSFAMKSSNIWDIEEKFPPPPSCLEISIMCIVDYSGASLLHRVHFCDIRVNLYFSCFYSNFLNLFATLDNIFCYRVPHYVFIFKFAPLTPLVFTLTGYCSQLCFSIFYLMKIYFH